MVAVLDSAGTLRQGNVPRDNWSNMNPGDGIACVRKRLSSRFDTGWLPSFLRN